MTSSGRAIMALFLAAILLAPFASAARSPMNGTLEMDDAKLSGHASFSANIGSLDLAHVARTGAFDLAWASAQGYMVTRERAVYHAGVDEVSGAPENSNATLAFAAGGLEARSCRAPCEAFVFALGGPGSTVSLTGDVDGVIAARASPQAHWVGHETPGNPDAFSYVVPADAIQAAIGRSADPGATTLSDGTAEVAGRVGILLWNVSVDLREGDDVTRYDTGSRREVENVVAGRAVSERTITRFIVLYATDAVLTMVDATGARFASATPTIMVAGALASENARGALTIDGERTAVESAPVRLEGDLVLTPRVNAQEVALASIASKRYGFVTKITGDIEYAAVAGKRVTGAPILTELTTLTVAGGTSAGAVALLVYGRRIVTFLLYSRFERSDVLDHEHRAALYESIKANPGSSVADLGRRLDMTRIVVRHHLGVLETHRFVSYRRTGRRLSYYASSHVPTRDRDEEGSLHNPTRRVIARAIVGHAASLTQRELATETGISRRLVSYHLKELERNGLITVAAGMPRAYGRTDALIAGVRGAEA